MASKPVPRLIIGAAVAWILSGFLPACSSPDSENSLAVKVDPRVELMSVIFRLAGNPEYNQGRVDSYVQDVDEHFDAFREHPVVQTARKLRKTRGVSYDAVMSMALHIRDPYSLQQEMPFDPRPAALERRWEVSEAREFLAKARDFVLASDFRDFIDTHQDLYRITTERMQAVMDEHAVTGWFFDFFGSRPQARFNLVAGLLNGGGSYGPKVIYPDGREELYTILGVWMTDEQGLPQFDARMLPTVVHEFCHSFANPIVERHTKELAAAGAKIFPLVAVAMRRQAYANWKTMMSESLVRASVVRWDLSENGPESAQQRIVREQKNEFFWISELAQILGIYESRRDTYPDLESFFPEIQNFFDGYAARAAEHIQAVKTGWEEERRAMAARAPKIKLLNPAEGARDVDPALSAIKITFDRPMKNQAWGVMRRDGNMPTISGDVFYDDTRTVFTIPVRLEPNTEYTFGLNSETALAFQDEKGNPLMPVTITFRTKDRR
jgi:hypothetical protein